MPLNVLPHSFAVSDPELVRLFHQSQLEWSQHLGEETQLDFGRWIHNPALPDSDHANCLHDAYLLSGITAQQLIQQMQDRSRTIGVQWRCCSLNPSMPQWQTDPLGEALLQAGWTATPIKILHRNTAIELPITVDLKLTIIPTRASYRHYHQLMGDRAAEGLLHLDDSHLDSLLALRDGEPVGTIGLLTSGQVGTIRDWYIPAQHRNLGIGRLLLNRALEISARGQLRHVMMGLPDSAAPAFHFARRAGFQVVGKWLAFTRGNLKS